MGNRAVLVSKDTTPANADKKMGIYVHWYGSEDDIKAFLAEAKKRNIRNVIDDASYGWARLCQTIADMLTEIDIKSPFENTRQYAYNSGIGIDIVSHLDCHNYDNGVYYIDENFEIVNHTTGEEFTE